MPVGGKLPMKVGICGGGVVGGGVYEILTQRASALVSVTKVAVRDLKKPRDWACETHTTLVSKWEEVVGDPEIEILVEVMGGVGAAKECVYEAIKKGKRVVTANKALLASCLDEIYGLCDWSTQSLGFEAAVCGGIPIIETLQSHLALDTVQSVRGIMNGTSNYMLSRMEAESGIDYAEVLKDAQALGYAEADPTADVEGHDVQAKIALCAKLAFGTTVKPDEIPTFGISSIQAVDFEYAALLDSTIKLLGTAAKTKDGNDVAVYVAPHLVKRDHKAGFAAARGPTNAVSVVSDQLGVCSLVGAGAGRYPTARSVVADVLRAANLGTQGADPFYPTPSSGSADAASASLATDFTSAFYVRVSARDELGIIKAIGTAAEARGVSINAVLQNPITNPENIAFVVTTDAVAFSKVQAFADDIAALPFAKAKPVILAILD